MGGELGAPNNLLSLATCRHNLSEWDRFDVEAHIKSAEFRYWSCASQVTSSKSAGAKRLGVTNTARWKSQR
jgi:hypothetical protein